MYNSTNDTRGMINSTSPMKPSTPCSVKTNNISQNSNFNNISNLENQERRPAPNSAPQINPQMNFIDSNIINNSQTRIHQSAIENNDIPNFNIPNSNVMNTFNMKNTRGYQNPMQDNRYNIQQSFSPSPNMIDTFNIPDIGRPQNLTRDRNLPHFNANIMENNFINPDFGITSNSMPKINKACTPSSVRNDGSQQSFPQVQKNVRTNFQESFHPPQQRNLVENFPSSNAFVENRMNSTNTIRMEQNNTGVTQNIGLNNTVTFKETAFDELIQAFSSDNQEINKPKNLQGNNCGKPAFQVKKLKDSDFDELMKVLADDHCCDTSSDCSSLYKEKVTNNVRKCSQLKLQCSEGVDETDAMKVSKFDGGLTRQISGTGNNFGVNVNSTNDTFNKQFTRSNNDDENTSSLNDTFNRRFPGDGNGEMNNYSKDTFDRRFSNNNDVQITNSTNDTFNKTFSTNNDNGIEKYSNDTFNRQFPGDNNGEIINYSNDTFDRRFPSNNNHDENTNSLNDTFNRQFPGYNNGEITNYSNDTFDKRFPSNNKNNENTNSLNDTRKIGKLSGNCCKDTAQIGKSGNSDYDDLIKAFSDDINNKTNKSTPNCNNNTLETTNKNGKLKGSCCSETENRKNSRYDKLIEIFSNNDRTNEQLTNPVGLDGGEVLKLDNLEIPEKSDVMKTLKAQQNFVEICVDSLEEIEENVSSTSTKCRSQTNSSSNIDEILQLYSGKCENNFNNATIEDPQCQKCPSLKSIQQIQENVEKVERTVESPSVSKSTHVMSLLNQLAPTPLKSIPPKKEETEEDLPLMNEQINCTLKQIQKADRKAGDIFLKLIGKEKQCPDIEREKRLQNIMRKYSVDKEACKRGRNCPEFCNPNIQRRLIQKASKTYCCKESPVIC